MSGREQVMYTFFSDSPEQVVAVLLADSVARMSRSSDLEGRLAAMPDSARRRSSAGRGSAWLAVLLCLVIVAPISVLSGQDAEPPVLPADIDATITTARTQNDFKQLDETARAAISLRQWAVAEKLLEASLPLREARGNGDGRALTPMAYHLRNRGVFAHGQTQDAAGRPGKFRAFCQNGARTRHFRRL